MPHKFDLLFSFVIMFFIDHVYPEWVQVGSAQKWYDELDNLAFSTPESELAHEDDNKTSNIKLQDDKVLISTTVNTSPGTSEVCAFFCGSFICCFFIIYLSM